MHSSNLNGTDASASTLSLQKHCMKGHRSEVFGIAVSPDGIETGLFIKCGWGMEFLCAFISYTYPLQALGDQMPPFRGGGGCR